MNKQSEKIVELILSDKKAFTCPLQHKNDFELLVALVLSSQTTDEKVNEVTKVLFKSIKSFEDLFLVDNDTLYNTIKSLGLGKTKTRYLKLLGTRLSKTNIPHTEKELRSLPGVGEKCACVFLSERMIKDVLAVDTHVSRVSFRLGLTKTKTPHKQRVFLEKLVPEGRRRFFHLYLINYGRKICTSKNPKCDICKFKTLCQYKSKEGL